MPKGKFSQRPSEGQSRTYGPAKDNKNPRKKSGNKTKGGEIFGKWHKPKLG